MGDFVYVSSNYECLPESVISLAGVAQPDYKSSAVCVSSEQCTYNRVLNNTRYLAVICSSFGPCYNFCFGNIVCNLFNRFFPYWKV